MQNSYNSTDDLTHNWNGSIAIKLTAIILWSVIISTFIITVPIMMSYENQRVKEYLWDDQQLINIIETGITQQHSKPHLEYQLRNYIENSKIKYISVKTDELDLSLGYASENNFFFPTTRLFTESDKQVTINIQHESLKKALIVDRIMLGGSILFGAIIFGLFIYIVTNSVVHNPLQRFVESTHKLSRGEKNLRFDDSREDEFGELARFSNEMLENIESQKRKLVDMNNELWLEIQNRDEALAASQQKGNFLANMSHEIRTPLSAIIGYTERLRYKDIKTEDEKTNMLDTVLESSNHLLSLINDILDFSKIEANKLEVDPNAFSIFSTIDQVTKLLHDKALEQSNLLKVEYQFPLPKTINNDATRTKQILLNLCSNALRFTNNGSVTILVSFDQNNNKLQISVKDTGIGMSEEALSRIFKPFSQGERNTSNEFGGTGLGLIISKRLTELMGGEITVQSKKDSGSTFTFSIGTGMDSDMELVNEIDNSITAANEYNSPVKDITLSGKVLLVEDTAAIRQLVKSYLEDYGIEVTTAINGQLGVKQALANDYDVILMDIQMPVMTGKEAVSLLRGVNYSGTIIALTADALTQQIEEYKSLGFTHVLTKPIDINQLLNILSTYLKKTSTNNTQAHTGVETLTPVTSIHSSDNIRSILDSEQGKRVIKKFLDGLPDMIKNIREATENKEIKRLKAAFHELKGVGGSVGFPSITQLATAIETPLANENYHEIKSHVNELDKICSSMLTSQQTLKVGLIDN